MKILYLEDDVNLSETIQEFLEEEDFEVVAVYDGEEALEKLYTTHFDLLLLDVQVPKVNGFDLLQSLRQSDILTPAIFTTSLNSIDNLTTGYDVGADDYIKKPFALKELLLRIKALLKREYKISDSSIQIDAYTTYNTHTHQIVKNKEIFTLNTKESKLLHILLQHINNCVTFESLFTSVWTFDEVHSEQSLRTYIKNLRKYVGKERIVSMKKQGYMFVSCPK